MLEHRPKRESSKKLAAIETNQFDKIHANRDEAVKIHSQILAILYGAPTSAPPAFEMQYEMTSFTNWCRSSMMEYDKTLYQLVFKYNDTKNQIKSAVMLTTMIF